MAFSKTVLVAVWFQISLAAVITKDAGDCAAFPDDKASLGEHALLQVSGSATPKAVLDKRNQVSASAAPSLVNDFWNNETKQHSTGEEETSPSLAGEIAEQNGISETVGALKEDQEVTQPSATPADTTQNMALDEEMPEEEKSVSSRVSKYSGTAEETAEQDDIASNVASSTEDQKVFHSLETPVNATQNTALNTTVQGEEKAMSNLGSKYDHAEEEETEDQDALAANAGSDTEQLETFQSSEASADAEQSMASSPVQSAITEAEACDWQCYLNRYPDLQKIVGADNVAAAEEHWNSQGQKEGRDCTCDAGESFAVQEDMTQGAAATSLDAKMHAVDIMTSCEPWTEETQEALQAELKTYEASEKFQEKISEAAGETPATAGHVAIMKYLREKVLQPGFSVLDLGCAAGGMLRLVRDEYDIGWAGVPYADPVPHDALVGVELVPGWVNFAQKHLKNISMFEGDITEYSLPEPYASKKFDLVMLNDVMGTVEKTRYGCFFSQLDKVTRGGSIVYMHAPTPTGMLADEKQGFEKTRVVPHHFVMMGMATIGFELVAFEHDMDTVCGGEGEKLPKQLEGAHCYENGMPKYTHNVFRKVYNAKVMDLS